MSKYHIYIEYTLNDFQQIKAIFHHIISKSIESLLLFAMVKHHRKHKQYTEVSITCKPPRNANELPTNISKLQIANGFTDCFKHTASVMNDFCDLFFNN